MTHKLSDFVCTVVPYIRHPRRDLLVNNNIVQVFSPVRALGVRGLEVEMQGVLRELGLREFNREKLHAFPYRRVQAPAMM